MNAEQKSRHSRHSRMKGKRTERQVVKLLVAAGLPALRVPMSGSVKSIPGDVTIGDEIYSVKARRDGLKTLYDWLVGFEAVFIKADNQEWIVLERLNVWSHKKADHHVSNLTP